MINLLRTILLLSTLLFTCGTCHGRIINSTLKVIESAFAGIFHGYIPNGIKDVSLQVAHMLIAGRIPKKPAHNATNPAPSHHLTGVEYVRFAGCNWGF